MTEMLTNNKIPHNKKRNVGLLYEFFTRYIGKAMLESRNADIEKAKGLIRRHFNKSTDLYKELKLFKTLKESRVSSREAALHLIEKVKQVATNQSQKRLDLEKTSLIHEINQSLNDPDFFNQSIQEYKVYGAIQILLNAWRGNELNENLSAMAHFEEVVIEQLMSKPTKNALAETLATPNEANRLVIDIMANKINKQFESLNEEQKKIITLYALQEDSEEARKELVNVFENLKTKVKSLIPLQENKFYKGKLDEINFMIDNDYNDIQNLTDDTVTFYLGISKLEKEFKNG